MNDKLKRLIADTAATLHCSKAQTEYLSTCMEMAYEYGKREQLLEDVERMNKITDKQIKK